MQLYRYALLFVASSVSFRTVFIGSTEARASQLDAEHFDHRRSRLYEATTINTEDDSNKTVNELGQATYGVDISYPIHHAFVSTNYDYLPHNTAAGSAPLLEDYERMPIQPLGDKQSFYDKYMQGCRDFYGQKGFFCDDSERERVAMNLRQPQSMHNYTELGFAKIKAPPKVFSLIVDFWEKNKDKQNDEKWSTGNSFINYWETKHRFVSVEDSNLKGGGSFLKQKIWDAARETMEEWTGEELAPCSLYGIRVYGSGAVLATHVDRLPLVISAIINVAQDVDEPWPLEVYGHDGKAYNITMEPGEMILYESHSVLHGRPFPLKGRFYANIFVHFEPVGHSKRNGGVVNGSNAMNAKNVADQYRRAAANGQGAHDEASVSGLPIYLIPGTPAEEHWRSNNADEWKPRGKGFPNGSIAAHLAAQDGNVEALREIAQTSKEDLHKSDANGWQPIHEASRSGSVEAVALLVQHGVNINERTSHGRGVTPLALAVEAYGKNHPVVEYIISIGGAHSVDEL